MLLLSPVPMPVPRQFLNPVHNQETSSKRSLYIDNWGHYTHSLQQQSMWPYLSHCKSTVNNKGTFSYHPQFTSPWGKKQFLILWSRVKWRPRAHCMQCDEKCLFTLYMKHGWLWRRLRGCPYITSAAITRQGHSERLRTLTQAYVLWKSTLKEEINLTLTLSYIKSVKYP